MRGSHETWGFVGDTWEGSGEALQPRRTVADYYETSTLMNLCVVILATLKPVPWERV
jgi:hypothetical protein